MSGTLASVKANLAGSSPSPALPAEGEGAGRGNCEGGRGSGEWGVGRRFFALLGMTDDARLLRSSSLVDARGAAVEAVG